MTPEEIAALLEITLPPELQDDQAKIDYIKQQIAAIKGQQQPQPGAASAAQGQQAGQQQTQFSQQPAQQQQVGQQPQDLRQQIAALLTQGVGQQAGPKADKIITTVQLSKGALESVKQGRQAQLDNLVLSGAITPAEKDVAEKKYLTDDRLSLSLSSDKGDESWGDFLEVAKARGGQASWSPSGRTPTDGGSANLQLSRQGALSPLAANREKRLAAHKEFQKNYGRN